MVELHTGIDVRDNDAFTLSAKLIPDLRSTNSRHAPFHRLNSGLLCAGLRFWDSPWLIGLNRRHIRHRFEPPDELLVGGCYFDRIYDPKWVNFGVCISQKIEDWPLRARGHFLQGLDYRLSSNTPVPNGCCRIYIPLVAEDDIECGPAVLPEVRHDLGFNFLIDR
jgi:hypothetical protein